MENFMRIDWMNFQMFQLVQFIIFMSFILVGRKLNRFIAAKVHDNINDMKLGHKASIFSLIKNYWLGFSGSSVIVFMAFGLGGLTIKMDFTFLILAFGLWTFYLVMSNKESDNDEEDSGQSKFF